MNEQILQLEKALLKNEAFMTSIVNRHHGKPELVASDIYTIAKILYDKNKNLEPINSFVGQVNRFAVES